MYINLKIEITNEDIDDIVCTALEGGITYWCNKCNVVGDYRGEWAHEQISHGGKLILFDDESGDTHVLTKDKLIFGIERFIEDYSGKPYMDIINCGKIDTCQVDAVIADIIVQIAIFGEVVYG